MKRAALGLCVITLGVVVTYSIRSWQIQPSTEQIGSELGRAQEGPSIFADDTKPATLPLEEKSQQEDETDSDTPLVSPPTRIDQETSEARLRTRITRETQDVYALLIEHLGLSPSEKDALLEFLIETRIAGIHTPYRNGVKMDAQDRFNEIEAIIGHEKLGEFLALEENRDTYAEVHHIGAILEQQGVPVTSAQQNRLFEIISDIRSEELVLPGADSDSGTIEYLDYQLARMDERERLVFEQVTSILSPEQVGYLFNWYQRDSYRRADSLERQKRTRADGESEDLPLHYPGRSQPDVP